MQHLSLLMTLTQPSAAIRLSGMRCYIRVLFHSCENVPAFELSGMRCCIRVLFHCCDNVPTFQLSGMRCCIRVIFHCCDNVPAFELSALADPEGGLRGLQPPPLIYKKKSHQHGRCDVGKSVHVRQAICS